MVLSVELLAMLLLGFVLGRIWQIRQQILLAGPVGKPQSPNNAVANRGSARRQAIDLSPSPSHRQNNDLPPRPGSEVRLRGGPAPFTGRFPAVHRPLQYALEGSP
jgi:hypothetical protein